MSAIPSRRPVTDDEPKTRRLLLAAATAFGVVYGVSFALLTWGYDSIALSSISAGLPWGKLLLGLPLSVLISVVVARRAMSASGVARLVAIWPLANGLLGAIAAHAILGASNILVWSSDSRFWRLPAFVYGRPEAVRTGMVVVVEIVLGAGVGLAQNLAVDWAWDQATPSGRMSLRSWLVMILCVPLAIFPAITVNQLINTPLRAPQQVVSDYLGLVMPATDEELDAAGLSTNFVRDLRDEFSERFTTHLVGFDPDSDAWFSASVDVAFDSGLVMRCLVFGDTIVQCHDISQQLSTWMGDLIEAGLGGVRRWETGERRKLVVGADAVDWLADHRRWLDGAYTVSREGQRGGWILMSADFETGFRMRCYFTSARPTVVDQCLETY